MTITAAQARAKAKELAAQRAAVREAADRERLQMMSFASRGEIEAMSYGLVRRLLDLMDARADVARDAWQER